MVDNQSVATSPRNFLSVHRVIRPSVGTWSLRAYK
jgi:hypothetical protein